MRVAEFKGISHSFGVSPKFVLWLQGCLRECPDCIAQEWQNREGGKHKTVFEIMTTILTYSVEGVVISGGEPLLQYRELLELLSEIKRVGKGIILYTGFSEAEVEADFPLLLHYCDLIIAGEYQHELNSGKGLRGSTNQTINMLTERYAAEKDNFLNGKRIIEITQEREGTLICGIPPFDINLLFKRGVDVSTKRVY